MQRIPVFAGRIGWKQWRQVAALAERYTPGVPLHITTRQDIEMHDLPDPCVPQVTQELQLIGLNTYGACGDSVRNITICPACEFDELGFDLLPLARLVRETLLEMSAEHSLPRKFKVSFSGRDNHHACPYISDLGFVVQADCSFQVIGAGSLGPRPQTGIVLYENMPAEDVILLARAALELFIELGDRQNRSKARLRHVRQRLGNDVFRRQLDERFRALRRQHPWPAIVLSRGRTGMRRLHVLQLPNGNIDPRQAIQLAEIAQEGDAVLRINLSHGLELYGPKPFALPKELQGFANLPCVVACPGAASCPRALVSTQEIAVEMQGLEGIDLAGKKIAVSGCPNGCAHSAVADIGLIGRLQTIHGRRTECFDILTGGGHGQTDKLAEKADTVPARQIAHWFRQRY